LYRLPILLRRLPQDLDIPNLISEYNETNFENPMTTINFTLAAMKEVKLPSSCQDCGACKELCP
jgi:hypothetical protein